jgi:hypothetical protein
LYKTRYLFAFFLPSFTFRCLDFISGQRNGVRRLLDRSLNKSITWLRVIMRNREAISYPLSYSIIVQTLSIKMLYNINIKYNTSLFYNGFALADKKCHRELTLHTQYILPIIMPTVTRAELLSDLHVTNMILLSSLVQSTSLLFSAYEESRRNSHCLVQERDMDVKLRFRLKRHYRY